MTRARRARERVRVALALDDLPEMLEALAVGELSYSAVRELTRIATRATEREWCDHARGKKLKQIEQAVATHRRGERPSDPPSPDLAPTTVEFEIRPATLALLREAPQMLALLSGCITRASSRSPARRRGSCSRRPLCRRSRRRPTRAMPSLH